MDNLRRLNASPDIPIPDHSAIIQMWKEVDFPKITNEAYPHTRAWVEVLATLYGNGTARHDVFRYPDHPVFDWHANLNRFHEMGFFEWFWKTPSVRQALPFTLEDLNFHQKDLFSYCSPFLLSGHLACCLKWGGAYPLHKVSSHDMRRLAEAAAVEMLGDDYDATTAYQCPLKWSDFFWDVAWDCTFVVMNPRERVIHVILGTDTD